MVIISVPEWAATAFADEAEMAGLDALEVGAVAGRGGVGARARLRAWRQLEPTTSVKTRARGASRRSSGDGKCIWFLGVSCKVVIVSRLYPFGEGAVLMQRELGGLSFAK